MPSSVSWGTEPRVISGFAPPHSHPEFRTHRKGNRLLRSVIHRLGTVEAGVFAGIGKKGEDLVGRRVYDSLDADCVSVHRLTLTSLNS
jgi:hypothetical protein